MGLVEMVMPKMGESIMEGTILGWLKAVGDTIEQDEAVLEVATDKVDTEVPAPFAGVLKEILAKEGDVIQVGKPIALLETEVASTANVPVENPTTPTNTPPVTEEKTTTVQTPVVESNGAEDTRFYSPLVKNMAKAENISLAELACVKGTGKDGRLTKQDMLQYIEDRQKGNVATPSVSTAEMMLQQPVFQEEKPEIKKETPTTTTTKVIKEPEPSFVASSPSISVGSEDEIIEMSRMRKMIANRMLESKRISPHVTSFVEADVTNMFKWRSANKRAFMESKGGALTVTPIFVEAIAKALKDYPMMNISVDGDRIIKKKAINIGVAVALPDGNLIVPVIKNADMLNLSGLAMQVYTLAKKARNNQLSPDDLSGGTYTISNVGSFGNLLGTPILVQPQVGIMAFGVIRKKPVVIETPDGDVIGIRHMMYLSHSYDHRVVDGALGGMFVRRVADYLENFDASQKI